MGIDDSVEQMTQAHLRNVQQLAVFYTGHKNIYAINIAKIRAFIITEEVTINDTPTDNSVISGIATIRGEPVTLVNLDVWLGETACDLSEYKLIVFCEFNHKSVGFLIRDMLDIVEKATDELRNNENQNSKITYTTYVNVADNNELCTVFNAEQLLVDIGWTDDGADDLEKYVQDKIQSDKYVYCAEDSQVAREVLEKFFEKTDVNYKLYKNGYELMVGLEEMNDVSKIALVITDIEMPIEDGYQVSQFIKENSRYSHIPVIINSSMTTDAVRGKMDAIGIDGFVGKTDIPELLRYVKEYI